MRKSLKKKSENLGQTLLNAFFPTNYSPPTGRVRQPLVGWSGLPTDQPMPSNPYAWGQEPSRPA
jgi:hypothetical protein